MSDKEFSILQSLSSLHVLTQFTVQETEEFCFPLFRQQIPYCKAAVTTVCKQQRHSYVQGVAVLELSSEKNPKLCCTCTNIWYLVAESVLFISRFNKEKV